MSLFMGFSKVSTVPAGKAEKAALTGANTVKVPKPFSFSTRPAAHHAICHGMALGKGSSAESEAGKDCRCNEISHCMLRQGWAGNPAGVPKPPQNHRARFSTAKFFTACGPVSPAAAAGHSRAHHPWY